MPPPRAILDRLSLVVLIAGFAVPLVSRLHEPEMRSDESIYAYSVERVLDTGDWLTPRYIPTDGSFLEKPPLKIWIVAGAMRMGLIPVSDAGHRFFDGVFGAIAFLYVYLYARGMAGAGAGLVAALTLFTMENLLYEHGLRSANMEAAVFLSYCGGVFHFARWTERSPDRGARIHAWAAAGWFVLGFMTKFVAAFFLPVIAVLALFWRKGGVRLLITRWTDWLWPSVAVVIVSAPWFVYQSIVDKGFWGIIFGAHVYQRFTTYVDPMHVQPWHYYVRLASEEVIRAGSVTVVLAGLARLIYLAARVNDWRARLALVWGVVPFALISLGSSKLGHYAYPFWPPIAIGAGVVFAWTLTRLDDRFGPGAERFFNRWLPRRTSAWTRQRAWPRRVLIGVALALAALAAATALLGPVRWTVDDTILFRNSSVLRPLFFAVVLIWIAGQSRNLLRLFTITALALLLPFSAYAHRIERLSSVDHPIREMRDCMREIRSSGLAAADGVLAASGAAYHHGYYFYLWREGPYTHTDAFSADQTMDRLVVHGRQTPVLIAKPDYQTLLDRLPASPALDTPETAELRRALQEHAVHFDNYIAALLPGPYAPCASRMLKTGAHAIW